MSPNESKSVLTRGVMRIFIESDTADSARKVASVLCEQLPSSLHAEVTSVEKYWKIPEWFEVIVGVSNTNSIEDTLASVQSLSTKWEARIHETDGNAMWSPEIGGTFAHPQVRWANIECYHQS